MATKMQLDLDKIEDFASRVLSREQVTHNLGVSSKTLRCRAKERAEVEVKNTSSVKIVIKDDLKS